MRYVPSIKKGLLSVGQTHAHGYSTLFEKGSWKLTRGSRLIVKGMTKGTLYCLHGGAQWGLFIALEDVISHMELWHKRRGHMSHGGLALLCNVKKLDVQGTMLESCNDYSYGKNVKCSCYSRVSRKSNVLDLVYINV